MTPVGGQGFLFGRGNQQLSASVIEKVDRERIVVVATEAKIARLGGAPLRVDTGDPALDASLAGYTRIARRLQPRDRLSGRLMTGPEEVTT